MDAQQLIEKIRDAGAGADDDSVINALCDGAALAALGVTDADQPTVEDAYNTLTEAKAAHNT